MAERHEAYNQICPWSKMKADECPAVNVGNMTSAEQNDHVHWHCLVEVEAGFMVEHSGGYFSLKEESGG